MAIIPNDAVRCLAVSKEGFASSINSIGWAGERQVTASIEVVEYEPNKKFGLKLLSYELLRSLNRWGVNLSYAFEATGEGVKVTQTTELERRSALVEKISSFRRFRRLAIMLQTVIQPPELVYNALLRRIGETNLSRIKRELQLGDT